MATRMMRKARKQTLPSGPSITSVAHSARHSPLQQPFPLGFSHYHQLPGPQGSSRGDTPKCRWQTASIPHKRFLAQRFFALFHHQALAQRQQQCELVAAPAHVRQTQAPGEVLRGVRFPRLPREAW